MDIKCLKLYATVNTDKHIADTEHSRFRRITRNYILVFDCEEPKTECIEITPDKIHVLTNDDNRWIVECVLDIISRKENQKEMSEGIGEKLEALEEKLAEAKKQYEEEVRNGRQS